MDLSRLYRIKQKCIDNGMKEDTAEVFARMFPFFEMYEYGLNVPQLASFLETTEKQTRRYVREMQNARVLVRLHYRAWAMSEAAKEL